jgi:hypothetical protein
VINSWISTSRQGALLGARIEPSISKGLRLSNDFNFDLRFLFSMNVFYMFPVVDFANDPTDR